MKIMLTIFVSLFLLVGCDNKISQESKDSAAVAAQQSQYAAAQPIPTFNWSLERHLVTQLYQVRNQKALTHSVWRSDRGMIEGDCASIGFGIPFDTSLTNPMQITKRRFEVTGSHINSYGVVEQAEPNGIFASKNTAATWVLCASAGGKIEPVYIETKVTVYPYLVTVDYDTNRVVKAGKSSVTISADQQG